MISEKPKPKRNIQKYDRFCTVSIDKIVPLILVAGAITRDKPKFEINGVSVRLGSLRLQTFAKKGTVCKCCGLKATHFAIERDMVSVSVDGPYHLNMWGVDEQNEEVLFTHDHTHARGLGGRDVLDNSETMCCFCNWEKGVQEQILAAEFTRAKHKAAKEAKAARLTKAK